LPSETVKTEFGRIASFVCFYYNNGMNKPSVFITRAIPAAGLNVLAPHAEITVWPDELPPSREELLRKVQGISGLLCMLTDRVDAAVMDAAGSELKVISQYAVGFDNIEVQVATARRISVGNTPGVLTGATADFTWALLMASARRVVEADRVTRSGGWKTWGPQTLLGTDVAGATIGIVGFGRIGQAVARRASGFDMRILYTDNSRDLDAEHRLHAEFVPLNDLLSASDYISLHTPLNPQTHHLIGKAQFALMKPGTILINTARGSVIDPDALYTALKEGQIRAAALDVTEPEPIPQSSPLLSLDNLIIAPHIASGSIQARERMAVMAAENILAGLRGERLPNCVNPAVYD
jgi:glyoxylate reductase